MAHTSEPGEAHQAFMTQLHEASDRFGEALPPTHRVAIAAQFLGQLIATIDDGRFDKAEIMQVVAQNIESGNEKAHGTGSSLPIVGRG